MLLQVLSDLRANLKKIYGDNHNIITLNKYFHHSLNYKDMIDLFAKYKGDIKKLKETLGKHIVQYENKKPSRRRQPERSPFFNDPIFENFFNEAFTDRLDPNQIYEDQDLTALFKAAQYFEAQRLAREAQASGQVASPDDVSLSSVLRGVIEIGSQNQKYAYLYTMLQDSGFNIEKFVKDDKLGKSRQKKLIDEHCTNLNKYAAEGKLQSVIGRENEIDQLVNILKKARKNNPVLVGKAGVGKTAIVEGLAKRIVEGDVPEALSKAVVYELRVMDMVKGTSFRGQFEQKMSDLLEEFKELEASGELPILFIDELHTIMGAGGGGSSGGLDFSNIIKPALARGELRTIGATTTDEWYRFIKENPALDRRFVAVTIKEPSTTDAIKIIQGSLKHYEKHHGVTYQKGSVERAVELSQQFIVDNALPDKAFDLIDYAGAMSAVHKKNVVEVEDIEVALARHKNIDLDAILESRRDKLEPLAPKLKQVIFGQDTAVDRVSRTVEKALAGLNAQDKPYGAFLLTGPTGTGKTELAKQVAKLMKAHFYRLDMSEFQEPHSVAKLIGSPAGYIGYDDGSSLTKVINENPRTVLLLDEIEKAHASVRRLLLQIMDYGKLTDSKGKEINFRNVLLIMTSNAGISAVTPPRPLGLGGLNNPVVKSQVDKSEIERIFAPEFRARLTGNGPLEFNPLTQELLVKIVNKYVSEVQTDRLNSLNIQLHLTEAAIDHIAARGLSKNLGARPVKDYIENQVIEPLTDLVLFGRLKNLKKMTSVEVDLVNGNLLVK